MNENINLVAHSWMEEHVTPSSIVIDATAGNGIDTAFLADRCQKVYAFDIQEEALCKSAIYNKERKNIIFIHSSHEYMTQFIDDSIDLIVFNFGYLPKGNHNITTNATSSKKALLESLQLLNDTGFIIMTFYIGHSGGMEEYLTVLEEIQRIDLTIHRAYQYSNNIVSPILLEVSK